MSAYEAHPAAELFPMMADDEINKLADNIASEGLLEPIVIHDGLILDGRNRYAACKIADVEPRFENPNPPTDDPYAYVLSKNLHRRHLTDAQRVAIAAEAMAMRVEYNKKAKTSNLRNQPDSTKSQNHVLGEGRSIDVISKAANVGKTSLETAYDVKQKDPELFQKIKDGTTSPYTAKRALTDKDLRDHIIAGGNGKRHAGTRKDKLAEYQPDTDKKLSLAQGQYKKMVAILSGTEGSTSGLETLDIGMILSVCGEELRSWRESIHLSIRNLRHFGNKLKGCK